MRSQTHALGGDERKGPEVSEPPSEHPRQDQSQDKDCSENPAVLDPQDAAFDAAEDAYGTHLGLSADNQSLRKELGRAKESIRALSDASLDFARQEGRSSAALDQCHIATHDGARVLQLSERVARLAAAHQVLLAAADEMERERDEARRLAAETRGLFDRLSAAISQGKRGAA